MATKIVTKNSSTASAVPTASDLVQGELAVNVADKRLFTEDNGGSIVELGTNPSTIDINAGTIDGAVIGSTTPAAITGSTVTSTGNIVVTGTVDGRDVATDGTKLDGIEANADVTDTTNVTAAGALMDSEVTNLAQVKAFDSADYATAAQGATADAALPLAGGALTGAVTTNSTFDGRDVATDGTKLDGIEVGATADQTAAEIKTAYESNADTNAFTDADHTKLDGIEASADVTDTANVTAAGAVMDSELTSEASVKALDQGVATTDSPSFAGLTVDTDTLAVDSTNNRVGIGTTSPSEELEIASSSPAIRLTDTDDSTYGSVSYNVGALLLGGDNTIRCSTGGSERMRIDSAGLVSIKNQTSPTLRLENLDTSLSAEQVVGALEFFSNDPSGKGPNVTGYIETRAADALGAGGNMVFATGATGSTPEGERAIERMRIDSSGKVGIGTTAPAQALTVNGTDARIYLTGANTDIDMDASANGQLHLDGNAYGFGIALNASGAQLYTNSVSRDLIFGVNETEVMRVTDSNVGIGTASPSAKLDVDGQGCFKKNYSFASTNYHIKLKSAYGNGISSYIGNVSSIDRMNIAAGGYYYGSNFYQLTDGATGMGAINIGEDGTLTYQSTTGATANSTVNPSERMRINSSGDLLVGCTTTPSASVDGVMITRTPNITSSRSSTTNSSTTSHWLFYNSNGIVGSIGTVGSATLYNTSSDYRLKTDAQPMTGATARLKALKPVNFEWIADGTRVDGFLAHEAQAVVPECVTGEKDAMQDQEYEVTPAVLDEEGNTVEEAVMGTRSVPDYQGIDQSKLVPLLVATIQELEARITQLENN